MASIYPDHLQEEYVTQREYREDMVPLREKVSKLSESSAVMMTLIDTMSKNLEKVANNTEKLNDSYKDWLSIKKAVAYIVGISFGVSMVLFSVDYSGWLRVINRYLNG